MRGWGNYLKAFYDLLLPRRCVVCGCRLNVREEYVCLYCQADMPFTRYHKMKRNPMSDRFNALIQEDMCGYESYAYAAALFFYSSEASYRHITYQIKYSGNIRLGRYFGRILGRSLSEAEWFADVDMVIPVPLHRKRRWKRGYNQAEVIASEVAAELGVPMKTDVLRRIRNTRTQTRLDISEKTANVDGAFTAEALTARPVAHILLVDDVFTTGATLHACYKALRQAFPSSVRISVATLGFVGN